MSNQLKNKSRIAVVTGGPSNESVVARNTATEIESALRELGFTTSIIELTPEVTEKLIDFSPDAVFPALHGRPGEDGTFQGLLDILQIPYVGSGVLGSSLAMDKPQAKKIFRYHDLPVPDGIVVESNADSRETVAIVEKQFGKDIVLKPIAAGSALGVHILRGGQDAEPILSQELKNGPLLVEPFILGREITASVLEKSGKPIALPIIEIKTKNEEWYDFKNRYTPGKSEHVVPANLDENISEQIKEIALKAHTGLGLRDLSRSDFILSDSHDIFLLETNTLPGFTKTSLYPDSARSYGMSFVELVGHLIEAALARR